MYFDAVLKIKDFNKDVVAKLVCYRVHFLEDYIFEYSFDKFEISRQNNRLYVVQGISFVGRMN